MRVDSQLFRWPRSTRLVLFGRWRLRFRFEVVQLHGLLKNMHFWLRLFGAMGAPSLRVFCARVGFHRSVRQRFLNLILLLLSLGGVRLPAPQVPVVLDRAPTTPLQDRRNSKVKAQACRTECGS